jgi:hypothetical protein
MTINPLDMRHFSAEVFVDLMTRLQQAVDDHVARFPDLDRTMLRLGVVSGAAQVFGGIVRESCGDNERWRDRAVASHCITFAKFAGAPIEVVDGPEVKRDPPGRN